jgi:hypothetical protein
MIIKKFVNGKPVSTDYVIKPEDVYQENKTNKNPINPPVAKQNPTINPAPARKGGCGCGR